MQHGGAAGPEREIQTVAQPEGEKQLGDRKRDVRSCNSIVSMAYKSAATSMS
jgi:hypothetical protein